MAPSVAFFGGSMSPGEMLVVLAVALILFGAKRLPGIARSVGRALEELRRAARDVQKEIITADVKETFSEPVTPEQYAAEDSALPPGGRPGPEGDGAAWAAAENDAQSANAAADVVPPAAAAETAASEPAAGQSGSESEPPPAG